MASVVLRESALVYQLEQLAEQPAQPVEKVLETAVASYLDELQRVEIHAETQAYWDLHQELVELYLNQYVAIYQGEVVDHDPNVSQLEQRVRRRFERLPVLIAPIKSQIKYEIRWRGGRIATLHGPQKLLEIVG